MNDYVAVAAKWWIFLGGDSDLYKQVMGLGLIERKSAGINGNAPLVWEGFSTYNVSVDEKVSANI